MPSFAPNADISQVLLDHARNIAGSLQSAHGGYSAAVPNRLTLIALALGLVSATGFAPLNLWPLTLICLAAWMHVVFIAPNLKAALTRGYAFGLGHFIVGLNWIAGAFRYQDAMPVWLGWIAVAALSIYIAIYPAMAAGLAWRWGTRRPRAGEGLLADKEPDPRSGPGLRRGDELVFILFFAAAWIITEWLRAVIFTGFAWNPLSVVGTSLVANLFAPTVGAYGFSGALVLVAGSAWSLYRKKFKPVAIAVLIVLPVALYSGYKSAEASVYAHYQAQGTSGGPLIRVVQPNIGQEHKYDELYDATNFGKLSRLTGRPGPEPRLILWPEAAIPDYLDEKDAEARYGRWRIAQLMGPRDMILTGGVKREFKVARKGKWIERDLIGARNNVWAMTPDQKLIWRYDKSHLVPYGEYLPLKPLLSAIGLSRLVPGDIDFWPGPGPQSYAVPGFGKVGVQICYEIIFSGEVIDRHNRPDFLFNPSNDAWFGAWGPPQHLAQARLRAIEEGIPVVRATPTGISAVIDANGQILASLPYQEAGYIQMRLPPAHPPTLFARYGNILPFAFALLLTAIGVALRQKRR